jgi:hypothetical protein
MKSIKQQYTDLKEGKMTQSQFMRNVRMTLPQYITNVTSFNDTVKILKNKAILNEADIKDKNQEKLEKYDQYTYTLNGKEVFPELAFFNNILKAELDDNIYRISEPVNGVVELNPIKGKTGMYTETDIKENENPYFSSDPTDGDREHDMESMVRAEEYYDKGLQAYSEGDLLKAERLYNAALKAGAWLGWTEFDLPPYKSLKEVDIYGIAGNPEEEAEYRREMNSFKTPEERYNVGREIDMAELDFLKKLYTKYQTAELEQEISDLKKKLGLMESYNSNSSGKDSYSVFPEIDNLNSQEVLSGIDWEMQNDQTLTKNEATKIVIKKLKKNPFYYTDWDMSGVEGAKAEYMNKLPRPADWQMKPVKGGSLVDKSMGMKPVKDVEKAKASSNKANQETNKLVKGVKELTHKAIRAKGIKGVMDMTGGKMKKINIKENQQYISKQEIINKILGVSKTRTKEELENMETKDLIKVYRNLGLAYKAPMRETTNLPGGDNVTDVAGHQLDEKKANSLKIGEKFEMQAKLGNFEKGQEVEVIDIQRWGEDFRITLSNGKNKDTFTIDKNDEL